MAEVVKCPVKFFARIKKCPHFLEHGTACQILNGNNKSEIGTLPNHCIRIVSDSLKENQSLDELHGSVQTCTNFSQSCTSGSSQNEFFISLGELLEATAQGFDASDW